MKEATIKDIARAANVSITTVSRVINGNYPVSVDARQRVEKAMAQLCYRPNAVARSLRSSRTDLVALVVPDISNRFFMELAKGLEDEIVKIGCNLIVASSNNSPKRESELLGTLLDRRIDGIVLAPVACECPKAAELLGRDMPVVLVDREIAGLSTSQVLWNDFETSRQLTAHLIQNGHRRIAMVNVTLENGNGASRLAGYEKALEDAHIALCPEYISASNFDFDAAAAFVEKVLLLPQAPTALFCANNIMLEGALSVLQKLGKKAGEDVSLVAFGNLSCNRYILPKITHAHQDGRIMGQKAGSLISQRLEATTLREVARVVLQAPIQYYGSVKRL